MSYLYNMYEMQCNSTSRRCVNNAHKVADHVDSHAVQDLHAVGCVAKQAPLVLRWLHMAQRAEDQQSRQEETH